MWPSFCCMSAFAAFSRNRQLLHPLEFFFLLSCFHTRRRQRKRLWLGPLSPLPDDEPASSVSEERQTDGSSALPVLSFWPSWPFSLPLSLSQQISRSTGATLSLRVRQDTKNTRSSRLDPEHNRQSPDSPESRVWTPDLLSLSLSLSLDQSLFLSRSLFTSEVRTLRLLFHHKPVLFYCGVAPAFRASFTRSVLWPLAVWLHACAL